MQWHLEAECQGTTSDLFFPPYNLGVDKRYQIEQQAKEFCKVCQVREECAEYAIANPLLVGVGIWGGMTYKEIKKARRSRSRN